MLSADFWKRKFKRAPDCAFREIEGEMFIVSSKSGTVHLLNSTGTFIWTQLDGARTLDEIARTVAEEFEVDDVSARADLKDFIEEINGLGLVFESAE